MIKKTLIAATLVASSFPAMAEVEISGNVALSTDYRFRGISQTDRDPAVSGGFDLSHDSGFYAGVWASNIQFAASIEADYYAGFSGNITDNIGYDVGVIYYDYPGDGGKVGLGAKLGGSNDLEFTEGYVGISGEYLDVSLSGMISFSGDYFGETGDGVYYDVGASTALPYDVTLSLHYGYQTIDEGETPPKGQGFFATNEDSYSDWSVGISASGMGLDFDLSYVDTNLSNRDCFASDACDATGIFTVSKSL